MDFSSFSTDELLALKKGDYSKIPTDKLLSLKNGGDSGPKFKMSEHPEIMNEEGLINQGVGGFSKQDFEKMGEDIATSKFGQKHPNIAAAVGTPVSMPLEFAAAASGLSEVPETALALKSAGKAITEGVGPFIKAITPGGKAAIGQEIGTADKAAGIEQTIPTVSNMAKKLDLPARERGFADIVNSVKSKLDSGGQISIQDASDFRDLVRQQYGAGKIARGTRMDAIVSQTNQKAGDVLNKLVAGRAGPAADYAKVSQIQNAMKTLAKGAGAVGGTGLAAVILRKLAGH